MVQGPERSLAAVIACWVVCTAAKALQTFGPAGKIPDLVGIQDLWLNAAPEIISNRRNYDGKMVDVWSAGVMLYVMLFCQYPFERSEDEQEKVPAKRYQMVRRRFLPPSLALSLPTQQPVPACHPLPRLLACNASSRLCNGHMVCFPLAGPITSQSKGMPAAL